MRRIGPSGAGVEMVVRGLWSVWIGVQFRRSRGAGGLREGNEGGRGRKLPEGSMKSAMRSMGEFGRLLTAAEVGERLGYSERYVWKLGREGVLPRVKVPGRKYVRFSEADVDRFVQFGRQMSSSRRTQPRPPLPRRF